MQGKRMEHLDLFSGIGGAALAVDKVWPDSNHTFVEIDKYCQTLLKLRFPNSYIHGDIRTFGLDTYTNLHGRFGEEIDSTKRGEQTLNDTKGRIDILTGGFPCQPFSQAGRRKGTDDDRHLWPEMLRVIREFKPRWVIGESVGGFVTWGEGVVLEQACLDLESEGYEVQPFVIPAVAVNAPHRRDRIWIVAHCTGERPDDGINNRQERHILRNEYGDAPQSEPERNGRKCGLGEIDANASDPRQQCGVEGNKQGMETDSSKRSARATNIERCGKNDSDTERPGRSRGGSKDERRLGQSDRYGSDKGRSWGENWLEVATELCGVDDGLPAELDGLKLSKSGHRTHRLKGLGNAWVPAVAVEIMKAIK